MKNPYHRYFIFEENIKHNFGPLYSHYNDDYIIQWHNVDKLFPDIDNNVARHFEALAHFIAEVLCNQKTEKHESTDAHVKVYWTDETKKDLFVSVELMGNNVVHFFYKVTATAIEAVIDPRFYQNLLYVNYED